jgi:UDP-GlcNAc:undecaprenyl-phosphate/decaprenyl-phosphate GlcNAc-1-phosphate transferase
VIAGPPLFGVVAFVLAALMVPVTNRLAFRYGAVVHPRRDRWSRQVVPILGGLAVTGAVAAVAYMAVDEGMTLTAWLAGLLGLTVIGLMDDLWDIRPRYRLLAEALLGAGFLVVVFDDFDPLPRLLIGLAGAIAIPVMTNATNLVDNSDGLASSLSAETALTIALTAFAAGMHGNEIGLGLVVTGACLGFLLHNRPPARVFMGDAGSLMLGFALAGAGALLIHDAELHGSPHATAAALAIPLAAFVQFGDVAMVSVTRIRRGVSPFQGGTDHTSHRLVRAGLHPWAMLGVVGFASGICGSLAVALALIAPDPIVEVAVVVVAGVLVLGFETVIALRIPFQSAVAAPKNEPAGRPASASGTGPASVPSVPAVPAADTAASDKAVAARVAGKRRAGKMAGGETLATGPASDKAVAAGPVAGRR